MHREPNVVACSSMGTSTDSIPILYIQFDLGIEGILILCLIGILAVISLSVLLHKFLHIKSVISADQATVAQLGSSTSFDEVRLRYVLDVHGQ